MPFTILSVERGSAVVVVARFIFGGRLTARISKLNEIYISSWVYVWKLGGEAKFEENQFIFIWMPFISISIHRNNLSAFVKPGISKGMESDRINSNTCQHSLFWGVWMCVLTKIQFNEIWINACIWWLRHYWSTVNSRTIFGIFPGLNVRIDRLHT